MRTRLGGPLTEMVSGKQKSPTSASSNRRMRALSTRQVRPRDTMAGDVEREAEREMTLRRDGWSLSLQLSRFLSHRPSLDSFCGAKSLASEMGLEVKVNLLALLIPQLAKFIA